MFSSTLAFRQRAADRQRKDGRGLTRGLIFKPDGTLVASVAQKGFVRQRKRGDA